MNFIWTLENLNISYKSTEKRYFHECPLMFLISYNQAKQRFATFTVSRIQETRASVILLSA